jgi:Glycosyltransferase family 87
MRSSSWPAGLLHRRLIAVVAFVAVCGLLLLLFALAWTIPIALGDDWLWYRDGVERLADGRALYDERMLASPFDLVASGLRYVFNQVPWSIPLFVPFALLAEPWAQIVWLLASDAALIVGLALVWPRGLSASTQLILAFFVVLNPGFVMSITWGNLGAWSVLGIGLFRVGFTRGLTPLMALGLCLSAMKLVPIVGLALMFVRPVPARRRTVVVSVLVLALMSLPAILANGPSVIRDFLVVATNLEQVRMSTNLSPSLWLAPVLAPSTSLAALRLATAVALVIVGWRVQDRLMRAALGLLLSCLFVTNLYADWLMIAVSAGLMAIRHPAVGEFTERLFLPLALRPFGAVVGGPARGASDGTGTSMPMSSRT